VCKYLEFRIIGPEASTVPLDNGVGHYLVLGSGEPFRGEWCASRSISSIDPNLLYVLTGSLDPFGNRLLFAIVDVLCFGL